MDITTRSEEGRRLKLILRRPFDSVNICELNFLFETWVESDLRYRRKHKLMILTHKHKHVQSASEHTEPVTCIRQSFNTSVV